jgi:hypothetical protein
MNKDAKNPEEDWQGALFSTFEVDVQLPKKDNWTSIEQEIFPKKKRRIRVFLLISLIFLLTGIGMIYLQKSVAHNTSITSKDELKNPIIKRKTLEKTTQKKPIRRALLTAKNNDVENRKLQTRGKKGSDKSTIFQKKKNTSKKRKEATNDNTKQNQTNRPLEELHVQTETKSNTAEESIELKNNPVETRTTSLENPENSGTTSRNLEFIEKLNLLPIQFFSISTLPILQVIPAKEKVNFKPYFSVQVAPLVGRNIRIVSGTFNSDNTNTNALGERRSSLPKFGFHTSLNYHFHKRLHLNTGFQLAGGDIQSRWFFKYLEIDPTTNDVRLKTTTGEASTTDPTLMQSITNGTTGIYKLRLNHSFSLYSLPVGITYRFADERFSPYFRTGLNMEFFGKRTLSIDVMENGITRNVELSLNRLNNRLNLQIMLAFGVETQLKSNWNIFAEAGYYAPLNQFVNSNGYAVRMAGSSILGGVRYIFRNKLIQGNTVTP